jgi:hypothetical protein
LLAQDIRFEKASIRGKEGPQFGAFGPADPLPPAQEEPPFPAACSRITGPARKNSCRTSSRASRKS